ncbi:uncharacterized protein LOC125094095 [Lutra lutra]|uniref:uncharacterized protein LOC125094095 n=1 Tax=Lutra lutra TaxID=9657 RepID=UPI001FD59870|nr:uncharacterized protein LOC125094095 [Lutra lutra]
MANSLPLSPVKDAYALDLGNGGATWKDTAAELVQKKDAERLSPKPRCSERSLANKPKPYFVVGLVEIAGARGGQAVGASDSGLGARVPPGQQGARAAPSPRGAAPGARAGSGLLASCSILLGSPARHLRRAALPLGRGATATRHPGRSRRGDGPDPGAVPPASGETPGHQWTPCQCGAQRGLELMTLRSRPELRASAGSLTHRTAQVPLEVYFNAQIFLSVWIIFS